MVPTALSALQMPIMLVGMTASRDLVGSAWCSLGHSGGVPARAAISLIVLAVLSVQAVGCAGAAPSHSNSRTTSTLVGAGVTVPDACLVLPQQAAESAVGSKLAAGSETRVTEGPNGKPSSCQWFPTVPNEWGGVAVELYGPPHGAVMFQKLLAESTDSRTRPAFRPTTTSVPGVNTVVVDDASWVSFLIAGILAQVDVVVGGPGTVHHDHAAAVSLVPSLAKKIADLDH